MKRSCRRSADENRIHDRAVKMRKMTDEQLVKFVDGQIAEAKSGARVEDKPPLTDVIDGIMHEIAEIKGVGKTKLHYIQLILMEKLEDAYG